MSDEVVDHEEPQVSIVVLSYRHPEVTEICLRTLRELTTGVSYEVVVVDNGSGNETVLELGKFQDRGWIDKLVLNPRNELFSGGNNIGVQNTYPGSQYILLLNSDVAFLRGDWLTKMIGWMEGTVEYRPSVWPHHPTVPDPGPRDIVSCGWSHDSAVLPGRIRPEGFCILFRRSWWRDLDVNFPWHGGMEHTVSDSVRMGAKCGVLSQYGRFLVHREGGSRSMDPETASRLAGSQPNIAEWFGGLRIESLDFTLGPDEHDSYLWWD